MNVELAQTIALIAYGNAYQSSGDIEPRELFPTHSTFQFVSSVTFQRNKEPNQVLGKPGILAKDTQSWFFDLGIDGTRYLKLDVLNLQHLPAPYATSLFTVGNTWIIQTDKGKCWQPNWLLGQQKSRRSRMWKVEYWERENVTVIGDFPDVQSAYQDLESCLVEAQDFSMRRKFGWGKWFEQALQLLHDPSPVLPYYVDLLPSTFKNIRARQLLAGTLQAWVFGGLGSWNDVYIADSFLEMEYQQISRNLYMAIMQAVGSVTNSTADYRMSQLSIS